MKPQTFVTAAIVTGLGLAGWITVSRAQGPMYDRVDVNLPYTVTVGDKTLQPGSYVIQQLQSTGDSRVLLIYSDNGMKFETSAMTIPAVDPNTPNDTKLILHHIGESYYFDKVWIQGKDYGYEFPLPNNVKRRLNEENQSVTVGANYTSTPSTQTTNSTTTAQNTQNATPPAAVPPDNTGTDTRAQNTTPDTSSNPPVNPPVREPDNSATAPPAAAPMPDTSANREAEQAPAEQPPNDTNSMPHTSAGWFMMLLSGGALSGAGLALRRKR